MNSRKKRENTFFIMRSISCSRAEEIFESPPPGPEGADGAPES
ncbi:MAG TPA: hypothetical protein VGG20_29105 [Thermoanaerobaculia bacterium]|jgi:hypothetical protein